MVNAFPGKIHEFAHLGAALLALLVCLHQGFVGCRDSADGYPEGERCATLGVFRHFGVPALHFS